MASEDRKLQKKSVSMFLFFHYLYSLKNKQKPTHACRSPSSHICGFPLSSSLSTNPVLFLPRLAFQMFTSSIPILTPYSSHPSLPPARRGGRGTRTEELRAFNVSTGIICEQQWKSSCSDNTQGSMFVSVYTGIILTFWKGRDKYKRNLSSLSAAPLFWSSASISSLYPRPVWTSDSLLFLYQQIQIIILLHHLDFSQSPNVYLYISLQSRRFFFCNISKINSPI